MTPFQSDRAKSCLLPSTIEQGGGGVINAPGDVSTTLSQLLLLPQRHPFSIYRMLRLHLRTTPAVALKLLLALRGPEQVKKRDHRLE